MNTYSPGAGVDLDYEFRDPNDVLVDPSTATLEVMDADGAVTTYFLTDATRLSVGVYRLTIVIANVPGRWHYRGVGTGNVRCATPDHAFFVEATRFTV